MNNVVAISSRFPGFRQDYQTQNYAGKKALHTIKLLNMLLKTDYKFEDEDRKSRMLVELQAAVEVIETFIH